MPNLKAGDICPECKAGRLATKTGRFGEFVACSKFPDCKYIVKTDKQRPVQTDYSCDKCNDGKMLIRDGRFGKFMACSRYPKCQNTKKIGPNGEPRESKSRF